MSLCRTGLADSPVQVLNQRGMLLLAAARAWYGELMAHGNLKNHPPEEQSERNEL